MMPQYHHIRERCQKIDSKEEEEEDEDVKISAIASNENMLELKKNSFRFPLLFHHG
jgi:hypothetical protein